jgi:hypothetical protein
LQSLDLALGNAARWRSVPHNPHLGRFPLPGGQPVSKSREVGAPESQSAGISQNSESREQAPASRLKFRGVAVSIQSCVQVRQ